jgi:putative ABC transport system permease protein
MSTSRFPRVLWRMARRDLRRHLSRSVLIVALVALPVAGLTAGIVLLHEASPTGAQRAADVLGAATLRVDATSPQARLDAAALPAGSRTLAFSTDGGLLRVGPGDVRRISLTDLPLDDPLTAGMLGLHTGRAPRGPGEVAVSTAVLRELGRRVGDTLQLAQPDGTDRTVRITGTVLRPADTDAFLAVTPRGALGPTAGQSWLVALPAGAAGDQSMLRGASGLTVTTREEASSAPRSVRTRTGVLNPIPITAGLALMIAALVAAAAFAAGVRREIRELGLLAAAGGSPAQLRAAVLARGATLGVTGGVAGLALGVLAAVAVHPMLGGIVGHLPRPIALPPLPLVGVAAAAVLAGTAAAWFPARFASRVPPVEALDARIPSGPPPRHVSRLGILAIVLGCIIAAVGAKPINNLAVSLAGLALLLGGFVACSAAVVAAVEPLAPHLPLAGRAATRQAARNRSRAGPAVAAIAVALAVPVFVSSVALTARGDDRAHWLPALGADQLKISHIGPGGDGGGSGQIEIRDPGSEQLPRAAVRAVLAAIPGAVAAPLRAGFVSVSGAAGSGQVPAGKRGTGGPMSVPMPMVVTARQLVTQAEEPGLLYVGGDDLLAALGAQSAAAALAAGKVVGIGPATVSGGQVALHRADFNDGHTGSFLDRQARLTPAVQVEGQPRLTIRYVISTATAQRLGLVAATQGTLVRAPHTIRPAELAAAQAALAPYPELVANAGPGTPPQSVSTSLLLLLFAVSAAVALAVVAAMVGLSQAEAAPERRTLFAVGASPSVLRGTAAATAGLLALLGGILAVPAGLLPLAAIYVASPAAVPLVIPWTGLALIVVGVPALAAAGGATLTRTNLGDRALWSRWS